jgi:hypothetical protein
VGRGVIGMERMPRPGLHAWLPILERKEALAAQLDADWFMHADPDEIRLPPDPGISLVEAFARADREGYNAVNFLEFAFVPTQEAPDHDHPDFARSMRWYYPFLPSFPNRLNAWKRQAARVELAWSGGHQVRFPGLRMYPQSFPMKHYLFLSLEHARRKYMQRSYDPGEVAAGWHRARAALRAEDVVLQSERELRVCGPDGRLDPSDPLKRHPLFAR